MTREEAINILNGDNLNRCAQKEREALEMAIQALSQEPTDTWSIKDIADTFKKHGLIREQEPCTDAVSREAVIERLKKEEKILYTPTGLNYLIRAIGELPPVDWSVQEFADRCRECGAKYGKLLEQKSGKWLYKEITDDYRVTGQCSECKERRIIDNYCPNCGAKMESEE